MPSLSRSSHRVTVCSADTVARSLYCHVSLDPARSNLFFFMNLFDLRLRDEDLSILFRLISLGQTTKEEGGARL